MDYEKKYKEAQKWIESIYSELSHEQQMEAEAFFPELKESEDERIRKEIIATIHLYYGEPLEDEAKEMIAWLEKLGEQKPAIKVEPKFKNGQWIVWQDKYYKVNYNGCGYELVDQNGLSTSLEYGTIEENAHLWTIQDAKDGDVLVYNNSSTEIILLFEKWIEIGKGAYSYVHIYDEDILFNDWSDCGETAHPATKEQRDLLFQKMKEAGYEWDSEKKELKKIDPSNKELEGKV